jgi:hypothetical protein
MLHTMPTEPCHPSHPVRGSVEMLMRHMAQDTARFDAFNTGYVKMSIRRVVDHDAIKVPLNRFMSYGIAPYSQPFLVTKTVYDQAAELFQHAIGTLGTAH